MRTLIAIVLVVAGLLIAFGGIGFAITELVGLYGSTIADPLGEGGGSEKDISRRMLIGVGVGAAGVLPLMIGSAMLKIGLIRKLRERRAADVERAIRRR